MICAAGRSPHSSTYHQIRNSCKFVPYKDRKAACADLKKIYGAVNLDDAEFAKEEFREKWDKKYPNILKFWDKNWAELTVFFEYPQEIRKIIYTTNAVEGYHSLAAASGAPQRCPVWLHF